MPALAQGLPSDLHPPSWRFAQHSLRRQIPRQPRTVLARHEEVPRPKGCTNDGHRPWNTLGQIPPAVDPPQRVQCLAQEV